MAPSVTYALLGLCVAVFFASLFFERSKNDRFSSYRRFAWIAQIAAVLAAYAVLRPGRGNGDPQGAVSAALAARTPVFLDFYSNY